VDSLTGIHIPVREIMQTNCPGFSYGDMTSVAVSTQADVIAVALQSSDYTANGMIALLSYDGKFITAFEAGVQPDMIAVTSDGMTLLTANEGEPRGGAAQPDPGGSVTTVELNPSDLGNSSVNTLDFTGFDAQRDDLANSGVILRKGSDPSADLEPEYIAISGTTAYVALQEANAVATLDLTTKTFTGISSLGFVEYARTAIDLGNNDGAYSPATYGKLYGIRMPDGISACTLNGKTYLLTANEGDSRADWSGLDNEIKSTGSPNGSITLAKKVTWFDAAQYDGLSSSGSYLFGGRSFSVFEVTAGGLTPVYDSGSDFESKTAGYLPDCFNCSNDNVDPEDRSGKKGVEPENVTVGAVNGRTYAFIALERIGGIMIYDVTNPADSYYVNYISGRDFAADIAGDVSPEGLQFAAVNGNPTLLASHEVSGTVCAYTLEARPDKPSDGVPAQTYTITASAGTGGSITPSGSVSVNKNGTRTFTITANPGYATDDVLVDGESVGAVATYTFENVTGAHTISAAFKKQAWQNPFADVKETDWYYEDVKAVIESGIMNGMSADTFEPGMSAGRDMTVTILYRLAGSPAVAGKGGFSDTADGEWYTDAVIWAAENGISNGSGNGDFGVGRAVTRQELAVFLCRYAERKGCDLTQTDDLSAFGDQPSDWARAAMQWAVGNGIIGGRGNGILEPQGTATRAEMAAMLNRFMAKFAE
jgi:hypothetical protein